MQRMDYEKKKKFLAEKEAKKAKKKRELERIARTKRREERQARREAAEAAGEEFDEPDTEVMTYNTCMYAARVACSQLLCALRCNAGRG